MRTRAWLLGHPPPTLLPLLGLDPLSLDFIPSYRLRL